MSKFIENGKPFPRTAKDLALLVGKTIIYVEEQSIDKSGRGYFSISEGKVISSHGKNVEFENGDWRFWRDIREYKIKEESENSLG